MFERGSLRILEKALTKLDDGFASLPEIEHMLDGERIEKVMLQVAEIMQDNYPCRSWNRLTHSPYSAKIFNIINFL
jgi:hypothetical protein